jgi:hypothetical protein
VLNNKASGAVRCRHPPQLRPGGGALPTPSEPRGSYTRKRRDVPADDAPGRPFTARPAPPPCHEPPRTRGSVRQDSCLFSTDPRPRRPDRLATAPTPAGLARPDRRRSAPPKDPMRTGRQVFSRTAWPPISTTGAAGTEMRQLQRPTPDSPPWEGPRPPADPRHPTLSLLRRAMIEARPDALAYWRNSDPNPSSQQPVCRYSVADSCAWIPKQRTIHRPLIHGIVHKAAVALT